MPKQQTHVGKVRLWLSSLGVLTAVSISRHEAEMRLAAYLPMLMSDFPDGAFTADSLNHVAKACIKGFPTYPELHAHLRDWWREHRPAPPALPPPPPIRQRAEPTPEEREHVERVTRETVAWLRSSAQPIEDHRRPGAVHFSPEILDRLNPLPNGRKRTDGPTTAAEALDTDAAAGMAWADRANGDTEDGPGAA